jgi:hypothetical protein
MPKSVYFAKSGDAVKIGVSNDVPSRLHALAAGNPDPITLIGSVPGDERVEHAIHARLSAHRIHREWFSDCPDLRDLLHELQTSGAGILELGPKPVRSEPSVSAAVTRVMALIKEKVPSKTSAWLAGVCGRNARTVQRWLRGHLTPDGEAMGALLVSEIGPAIIEAEVERFPPARRAAFWRNVHEALIREEVRQGKTLFSREPLVDEPAERRG